MSFKKGDVITVANPCSEHHMKYFWTVGGVRVDKGRSEWQLENGRAWWNEDHWMKVESYCSSVGRELMREVEL